MGSLHRAEGVYKELLDLLSKGKRVVLASVVRAEGSAPRGTTAKIIVTEELEVYGTIGGGCAENYVIHEAKKVLNDRQLRMVDIDLGEDSWSGAGMACGGKITVVMELIEPKPRLVILGAGHLAKALSRIGQIVDFSAVIIDPLAKEDDFPGVEIVVDTYSRGLSKMHICEQDNAIILTRHHADEEALRAVIDTSAGYKGIVGSKTRLRSIYEELAKQGISRHKLLNVHGPIGLDIEAETPEEIAISIISEILMVRRGGKGTSMKLKASEWSLEQEPKPSTQLEHS